VLLGVVARSESSSSVAGRRNIGVQNWFSVPAHNAQFSFSALLASEVFALVATCGARPNRGMTSTGSMSRQ
jgi:hypothetical protein